MSTLKVNKIENTATTDGGINIYSSGSVGLGITNPGDYHSSANSLVTSSGITLANTTQGSIFFADSATGTGEYVGQLNYDHSNNRMQFVTDGTERQRISSAGAHTLFSDNTVIFARSKTTNYNDFLFYGENNASSMTSGGAVQIKIQNDGDIKNTDNSYGAISDVKLKENIVDASSQWNDIKGLKVRNYNFKKETGYNTHTQLGLVAQELELICPGLVDDSPDLDRDGNDLGTVTKSINYSVLYMKAVKALQEAIERIETLEAKVAALEAG